jgi:glutaredoxin-related protein
MKTYYSIEEALNGLKAGEITWERLLELKDVYDEAYKFSKEYGYVGVGCISWADRALHEYQDIPTAEIEVPVLYTDEDFA